MSSSHWWFAALLLESVQLASPVDQAGVKEINNDSILLSVADERGLVVADGHSLARLWQGWGEIAGVALS